MNVYEMEGFLRGKCMPRDILVNESTAEYLVRKLNDATAVKAERDALAVRNEQLMAFVTEGFNIAGQGGSWCGGDIQEFGEKFGLFARETYQPVLHGYHCGHEPGEDSVYVITKSATDAALAAIRTNYMAEGAEIVASKAQVIYQERHKSGDFESAGKYLTTIKFANNIASDIREAK